MIKDILQGKPVRHPLHPFLVHFPIGLFTLSLLLDVGARLWPDIPGLERGAFYSMAAGVVMALLAAVPGFVDYTDIRRDHPARKIANAHMLLNLLVIGVYAVNLGVRNQPEERLGWLPLVLSLAAYALLGVSGHLGGKMVFDDGIAVGRHRRETRLPSETLRAVATDSAGEFVRVAQERDLRDGETLRVDVEGTIVVVARFDGQLLAFQEFCTHRFGPLSEGCMRDGEIECPWHRSRFDMRTGKVTEGPARLDLKTYRVKAVGGHILVAKE
jgi:nitrite reductase/ring-hydroxylating ferredoxin subunit/uncharacterized membrane protein